MTDKDVKRIIVLKSKYGFIVEIGYTNGKMVSLLVDGFDLGEVFKTIDRQNNEVHRDTLKTGGNHGK